MDWYLFFNNYLNLESFFNTFFVWCFLMVTLFHLASAAGLSNPKKCFHYQTAKISFLFFISYFSTSFINAGNQTPLGFLYLYWYALSDILLILMIFYLFKYTSFKSQIYVCYLIIGLIFNAIIFLLGAYIYELHHFYYYFYDEYLDNYLQSTYKIFYHIIYPYSINTFDTIFVLALLTNKDFLKLNAGLKYLKRKYANI